MYILAKDTAVAWMTTKKLQPDNALYQKVIDFYDRIIPLAKSNAKVVIDHSFREEERLRYIIIQNNKSSIRECQTWVIPSFDKEKGFKSAGFSTKDKNVIEVLTSVTS